MKSIKKPVRDSVHAHVERLIEEMNEAYSIWSGAGVNADFAEFAALSLAEFKAALGRPDLTEAELIALLRKGGARHKGLRRRACWKTFLAAYIQNRANNNKIAAIGKAWRRQTGR